MLRASSVEPILLRMTCPFGVFSGFWFVATVTSKCPLLPVSERSERRINTDCLTAMCPWEGELNAARLFGRTVTFLGCILALCCPQAVLVHRL